VLDSCAEGPGFISQPCRCRVTVLGKLFTPYRVSVHQAAKLGPALLRVARVTAGLAESNGRNDLDVSKLQSALDLTADWANDCQLSVSVDKCSVLLLKLVMAQQ